MKISSNFNRFIFGVVLKDIKSQNMILKFSEPKFIMRTAQISSESLRDLLKHLDFTYPRDSESKPLSYTKLDSKQMTAHIQWIELICSQSGFTLQYISDEWDRLLQSIH